MLRVRQIQFVLTETTFHRDDSYHTSLFSLAEYLHLFGDYFVDLYDHDFCLLQPHTTSASLLQRAFHCVQMSL